MQKQTEIYYRGYKKQYGSQRTHLLWLTDDIEYAKEYGDTVEEYVLDASKLKCASLYKMDEFSEAGEIDYLDGPTKEEAELALKAGYNCYAFEANSYSSDCLCLWDKSPIISRRILSDAEVEKLIDELYINESKKPKKVVRNDEGEVVPEHCSCGGKVGVFIEGEPIYKCTACGKYYGTMPFNSRGKLNEGMGEIEIKEERVNSDEICVSAYQNGDLLGYMILVMHDDIYSLESEVSETDDYDTANEVISRLNPNKGVIELADVDVNPKFRNMGISKKLLEYVLNKYSGEQFYLRICPTDGVDEQTLAASVGKYGFIEIDSTDNGTFMVKRASLMEKTIIKETELQEMISEAIVKVIKEILQ